MARQRFDTAPEFRVADDSVVIQQVAGSSAPLLELKDHTGTALMSVNSSGQMTTTVAPSFVSPSLTGTPTAPTASAGTNTTQIATTEFVKTEIANLVDAAPVTLDTLNELAAALGDDANFATTITNSLATKAPLASPTFTGTVTLPSGTVTSSMILDGTIVNADINSAAAIDKTKISGTAITAADTGTVTSAMIADDTIVNSDISPTAAIAVSKLASGTSGQIIVADASGIPTYTTLSGDITISSAGVATIQPNSVALSTDTTGDYVASLVAGTGVTLTNNAGEGATPTVAIGQAVGTTSNVTFNDVTVSGNLTVNGTTTTLNSTALSVDDINITLGDTASPTDTTANGGGITLKGATDKSITWSSSTGSWGFSPSVIFTTVAAQGRGAAIAGDSAGGSAILQFTNNAVSAQWGSVYATSTGRLVLTSQNDGVGIGGTPSYPFHVQSSNYNIAAIQSSGAETKVSVINTSTNGRHYAIISGGSGGAYSGGSFGIYDNTAAAVRLLINSSGTVYIPGQVNVDSNGADGGLIFRPWTAAGGYVSIATRDMAGAEYMMLSEGTNTFVGCGSGGATYIRGPANSTTGQLYVNGSEAGSTGHFYAQSTATFGGTGTSAWYMPYLGMYFNRLWDNYPGIMIVNDQTWGPPWEFRIHGYSGPSGGDFGVYVRSDGGGNASDGRIKTNITTIDNALDKVMSLRGVRYQRWNRSLEVETHMSEANGFRFGVIAQEVMPIIPEVVKGSDNPTFLENGWSDQYSVDYGSITPLLIEAIKELTTRVQQLEAAL